MTVTIDGTSGITYPAGTIQGTGYGPAFNVTLSSNQSVSSGVATKVTLNSELFDTANCFDSTTNYRFTPNVAGYYQFNGRMTGGTSSITSTYVYIYKNGSAVAQSGISASVSSTIVQVSDVIYMNGTTDYVELYAQVSATTPIFYSSVVYTNFSGTLVRGA